MKIFKRGVRFSRMGADEPLDRETISLVVDNLTQHGLQLVAAFGLVRLKDEGYSLNQFVELFGEMPKEGK